MSKFKVFYSWQSDLPGNVTRDFIIQIVESPNEVLRLIQDMWDNANGEKELIFKI